LSFHLIIEEPSIGYIFKTNGIVCLLCEDGMLEKMKINENVSEIARYPKLPALRNLFRLPEKQN